MRRSYVPCLVLYLVALLVVSVPLGAQTTSGSILGTVTDPSGAVIGAANVVVTNVDTGIVLKTTTDSSGDYVLSPLAIARYSVGGQAPGFKTAPLTDLTL